MSARPVKWGLLSTANIGLSAIAPALATAENAELVAVGSRDAAKADEVARKHGIPRAHGSYEALLEDPEVEAIYNPLPNSLHAEWSIKALRAGKHVLCDKPFALRTEDAESVVRVAEECDRRVMEGFMWRFHPTQARVRELLDGGAIGDVRRTRASFNFRFNRDDRENIRVRPEVGGGAIWDVGCYCVNMTRFLMGDEPAAVIAWERVDPEFEVNYALTAMLLFSGDRAGLLDCGFDAGFRQSYDVLGERGTLRVDRALLPGTDPVTIEVNSHEGARTEEAPGADEYRLELEAFSRWVRGGPEPVIGPADAVANARVLEALLQSTQERQWVAVSR